jgi:hypothetical protein
MSAGSGEGYREWGFRAGAIAHLIDGCRESEVSRE